MHKDLTNTHKTHTSSLRVKRGVQGQILCEMGKGVLNRAKKQFTSGPKGCTSGAIIQQSKGCLIRLGIIQWLTKMQRTSGTFERTSAVLFIEYGILFVSVCPVVPPRTSSLKTGAYVWWSHVHPLLQTTTYVHTKDRGVHPPNLVYVWSRSLIFQNALMVDPSGPKFKLTLKLSYLCLVNYLGHYSDRGRFGDNWKQLIA